MWDYEDVRSRVHLAHSSKNYCTIRIFLSKWRASYFRGVYTEWVSSLHVCLRSASHFWRMFLELCLWMYHFVPIFFFFVSLLSPQFYRMNFNYISLLNIIHVRCEIIKVHIAITNNAKNSYQLTSFMQNGFLSFTQPCLYYVYLTSFQISAAVNAAE